ncbi:MAG: ATP-binding protein [Anaerolineae bacterium]
MNRKQRQLLTILANGLTLMLLVSLTRPIPLGAFDFPAIFLFSVLILFTMVTGIVLGAGFVSLLPLSTIVAFLTIGLAPTAWLIYLCSWVYGFLRIRWAARLGLSSPTSDRLELFNLTAVNAVMNTFSILAGAAVYKATRGEVPLESVALADILSLVLLGLTYFAVNHAIFIAYASIKDRQQLQPYLRKLPNVLAFEAAPLVFAPLVSLIYTQLGQIHFLFLALALVVISLITRSLDRVRQRLERRVQELDSLQVVGQSLSATLDLETILSSVYSQVSRLMQASTFYVALYDEDKGEVSFPFVISEGERVSWAPRKIGNGLTEHLLRTRRPLLVRQNLAQVLEELNLERIGPLAETWLGVPLLAHDELLGIISVQSLTESNLYDEGHQELLMTIAAQAAMAIQNARLYAQTDRALARRVQELDSILRTTNDGILLLDPGLRILTANRAFTEFTGLVRGRLKGQLLTELSSGALSLMDVVGYTLAELEQECQDVSEDGQRRKTSIMMPGPPERLVERTLATVHGRDGEIAGWLLIFRDISEEAKLARIRRDLTQMLVHDLRSPLSVIIGSLETIVAWLDIGVMEEMDQLLHIARTSGDRMLQLINDLLETYRLESGEVPLTVKHVQVQPFLNEISIQFDPLLDEAGMKFSLDIEDDLPPLFVDPGYVGRAVHNLLDNAIKFTPDYGRIRLWARLDTDGSAILLGVSDTGPGIPPEAQGKLFEKFQRDITTGGRRSGTGLGLSYCKLVAYAHGGDIWVESSGIPGEGATFIMRLPVVDQETSEEKRSG